LRGEKGEGKLPFRFAVSLKKEAETDVMKRVKPAVHNSAQNCCMFSENNECLNPPA
jgi:hypothetical protein